MNIQGVMVHMRTLFQSHMYDVGQFINYIALKAAAYIIWLELLTKANIYIMGFTHSHIP